MICLKKDQNHYQYWDLRVFNFSIFPADLAEKMRRLTQIFSRYLDLRKQSALRRGGSAGNLSCADTEAAFATVRIKFGYGISRRPSAFSNYSLILIPNPLFFEFDSCTKKQARGLFKRFRKIRNIKEIFTRFFSAE